MTEFLQFILIGLGSGAIFALVGVGIVQIFRGSDTLNFAQGGFALLGATLVVWLQTSVGIPAIPALVIAVLVSVLVGAIVSGALRPLRNASAVVRLIATTGVLAAIQQAMVLIFPHLLSGDSYVSVPAFYPSGFVTLAHNLTVPYSTLILLGVVGVTTTVVSLMMNRTRFGLATAASVRGDLSVRALGFSPQMLSAGNWAIGSALGGLAGILIVPISSLNIPSLTLIVVPGLAAALGAGFGSYWLTVAWALAIGVGESLLTRYETDIFPHSVATGWPDALPVLVIIVVLFFRGRAIPGREHAGSKLPLIGRSGPRYLKTAAVTGVALLIAGLASPSYDALIANGVLFGMLALSVVVVTGITGQVSFAQAALGGVAALVAARLATQAGLPFLLAGLAGTLTAVALGIVVGLPTLRSRGPTVAVMTLGLALAIEQVVFDNASITDGLSGTPVTRPSLFGFGFSQINHPSRYAMVAIVVLAILSLSVANLTAGAVGRRLAAVRSNERAAAGLGISLPAMKLYGFAFGAGVAGIAGVLTGFAGQFVNYNSFVFAQMLQLLSSTIIGGVGFVLGALLTVLQLPTGPIFGQVLSSNTGQQVLVGVSGLAVVLTLVKYPDGLAALAASGMQRAQGLWAPLLRRFVVLGQFTSGGSASDADRLGQSEPVELESFHVDKVSPLELVVTDLTVRFGAVVAVNGVSLRIEPGRVTGLIGANGAGKSTLIDAVTGFVSASEGEISLSARSLRRVAPAKRARLGIQRCFQSVELFEDLTVGENLIVAGERIGWVGWLSAPFVRGRPQREPYLEAIASELGLTELWDRLPGELPHGVRRLVGVARALAARPSVLLLDEPAGGLSETERKELSRLIRWVASDWGIAVLLVEHDVALVTEVSDYVVALNFGQVIAEGDPHDVMNHPAVRVAYLGEEPVADEPGIGAAAAPKES